MEPSTTDIDAVAARLARRLEMMLATLPFDDPSYSPLPDPGGADRKWVRRRLHDEAQSRRRTSR